MNEYGVNAVVLHSRHLGRSVGCQRVSAEEFYFKTRIARVLVHEKTDVFTFSQKAKHVSNTRFIGYVLLQHRPVFVNKFIGSATLLLSYGNDRIIAHGHPGTEKFPIACMRCHNNGTFTAFFQSVQIFFARNGKFFKKTFFYQIRIGQDFDNHRPESQAARFSNSHGLCR